MEVLFLKRDASKLLLLLLVMITVFLLAACSSQQTKAYDPDKKLGPQLNYTVTGIDASSGEMGKAKKMLAAYGLKEKISN